MKINALPHRDSIYTQQKSDQQSSRMVLKADAKNFTRIVCELLGQDHRLAWLFGTDDRSVKKTFGVHALLCPQNADSWLEVITELPEADPSYPSLTKKIMGAVWYERYLMDMFGIVVNGHPDPRRLVHHENVPTGVYPLRKDFSWNTKMKHDSVPYPMTHVKGNGVYEIPVGPIHAGIIEPGHFRFNVAGEKIITLEGKLFFTHKGVEKLLEGKTLQEAIPFVERISDDSAASHALAFAQAVESASGVKISTRAELIRTLIAEMERITMHIHDVSNIAGMGTGYSIMAAHGFRIKELLVRLSGELFGNRFWRGVIIPGGVSKDFTKNQSKQLLSVLSAVMKEIREILAIGLASDGLLERMVGSGVLQAEAAKAYGAVGVAVRATDQCVDTRKDHPYAAYERVHFDVVTKTGGDVFARFMVRVEEIETSFRIIEQIIALLDSEVGEIYKECHPENVEAFSAVEGWRGEILHFVRFGANGVIDRMAVRDPSFCNWPLFAEIGPGNIIPDFPLCNKSLNLSYSGCDL